MHEGETSLWRQQAPTQVPEDEEPPLLRHINVFLPGDLRDNRGTLCISQSTLDEQGDSLSRRGCFVGCVALTPLLGVA